MKNLKNLLFLSFLLLLCIPLLQSKVLHIRERPLFGIFYPAPLPSYKKITWEAWKSPDGFQKQFAEGLKDRTGFRTSLIRINNQYDYSLFGLTHAEGFIRGKDGMLFEEDYIYEYTGRYFIGESVLRKKIDRLKEVQDTLKKQGIQLILVIEPGKASFFPEYIPDHYQPERRGVTNLEYMTEYLNTKEVSYLDLNRVFLQMKDSASEPLFPKYGMHWSIYGVSVALDTLLRFISQESGRPMPRLLFNGIVHSDSLRASDDDIEEMLNLICPLKPTVCAYPDVSVDTSVSGRQERVLTIADSYYNNIMDEYSGRIFRENTFWYYNSKVYPHIHWDIQEVDHSNLLLTLQRYDIILLMVSEINLHCGFWNFVDQAYAAIHPGFEESGVYLVENQIRNDRAWFRFLVKKARDRSLTLEEAILRDAEYVSEQNR